MRKGKIPTWFILAVPIIIVCLLLLFLLAYSSRSRAFIRDARYHELRQAKIRPTLKRITGRQLPGEVQALRAIFRTYGGIEDIYLSFQTNQEGCSDILNEFGGEDVLMEEFPDAESHPFRWTISFQKALHYQKDLGVVVFDEQLLARPQRDALEHANMGHYPKDAVTGWYLEYGANSAVFYYSVLLFKDQGLVYIFSGKNPKGIQVR